jgi:hypothetical protein
MRALTIVSLAVMLCLGSAPRAMCSKGGRTGLRLSSYLSITELRYLLPSHGPCSLLAQDRRFQILADNKGYDKTDKQELSANGASWAGNVDDKRATNINVQDNRDDGYNDGDGDDDHDDHHHHHHPDSPNK